MVDEASIRERIHTVYEEIFPDAIVAEQASLDSLDRVTFLLALEDEFDLDLTQSEHEKVEDIDGLVIQICAAIDGRDGCAHASSQAGK